MSETPRSTLQIVRQLKSGELAGKNLSPADRRRCVEMLMLEGVSVHEAADLLGMSEKTVRRDRSVLRQQNAITAGHEAISRFLGDYAAQVDSAISRLAKLGRDPAAAVSDRIAAATAIPEIMDRFAVRLSDLGFKSPDSNQSDRLEELVRALFLVVLDSGEASAVAGEIERLIRSLDPNLPGRG